MHAHDTQIEQSCRQKLCLMAKARDKTQHTSTTCSDRKPTHDEKGYIALYVRLVVFSFGHLELYHLHFLGRSCHSQINQSRPIHHPSHLHLRDPIIVTNWVADRCITYPQYHCNQSGINRPFRNFNSRHAAQPPCSERMRVYNQPENERHVIQFTSNSEQTSSCRLFTGTENETFTNLKLGNMHSWHSVILL